MRLNYKEIEEDLRQAKTKGFKLYFVTGTFRGRPYVSEISGIKKISSGTTGFSYMACELRQRQMRKLLGIAQSLGAKEY